MVHPQRGCSSTGAVRNDMAAFGGRVLFGPVNGEGKTARECFPTRKTPIPQKPKVPLYPVGGRQNRLDFGENQKKLTQKGGKTEPWKQLFLEKEKRPA